MEVPIKTGNYTKKTIQKEMNFYAESGKLSENLQRLQPTSTIIESVFLISFNFCCKNGRTCLAFFVVY